MTGVSRHYVLAAGGTGGHLTPAFALAQELEEQTVRLEHARVLVCEVHGDDQAALAEGALFGARGRGHGQRGRDERGHEQLGERFSCVRRQAAR